MKILIVASGSKDWKLTVPGVEVIPPRAYLTDPRYAESGNARVINLSSNYRYQSNGYYVSLLAAARNHRPMPSVGTMRDLQSSAFFRYVSDDQDDLIQKSLAALTANEFTLSIYFGRNMAKRYEKLCLRLFNALPAPLIRAQFARGKNGRWSLKRFAAIALSEVPETHKPFLMEAAADYCARPTRIAQAKKPSPYSMGMLIKPDDPLAPSNAKALELFIKAGERLGIDVETITREDYTRVPEFDALFIRETTQVNNHTYRFARVAEMEHMPVIDDSLSILRCTNKVYLAELLTHNHIRAPRTMVVHSDNLKQVVQTLGLPCILKQPDSAFSLGVSKASTDAEFRTKAEAMLDKSDLIIAQEFLPTDFDWRIGVLAGEPLFACKYFMADHHWQIYNHAGKTDDDRYGNTASLPLDQVPLGIVKAAVRTARLIGNGLYGVDIKEHNGTAYIIEINDNPSIDFGIEDVVLGNGLYDRIMQEFLRRILAIHQGTMKA